MILQFFVTMSRSSAKHVGFASALVCALGATEAGAHELGFDALGNELEYMLEPVTKRQLSDGVVLAQYVDEDGDEFVDEDDDEYADDYSDDANSQGLSAEQQQRLNRVLDRQVEVIEKTILWRDPLGPGYY